jgi:hypothetical protein
VKTEVASFALLGSVVLGVTPAYADAPDVSDRTAVVSAGTNPADGDPAVTPEGRQLFLATDEQYVQTFGATKAAQQGLTHEAVTEADSPADAAVVNTPRGGVRRPGSCTALCCTTVSASFLLV